MQHCRILHSTILHSCAYVALHTMHTCLCSCQCLFTITDTCISMLTGPANGLTQTAAYVNENAATNKQLTTVTVTVPQTPGTKGSKAGKHVLSALSWGQLFSTTWTKHASKKCYQHFARAQAACKCYNSCLQLYHWRQQLLPAARPSFRQQMSLSD